MYAAALPSRLRLFILTGQVSVTWSAWVLCNVGSGPHRTGVSINSSVWSVAQPRLTTSKPNIFGNPPCCASSPLKLTYTPQWLHSSGSQSASKTNPHPGNFSGLCQLGVLPQGPRVQHLQDLESPGLLALCLMRSATGNFLL